MYIVAAVVVVAIVVVLAVLSFHLLLPSASASLVVGKTMLYSQAIGPAEEAQTSIANGPWAPTEVIGLGVPQSASGYAGLVHGCTVVWETSSTLVVPATPANASAGALSVWIAASDDAAGNVLLTFVNDLSGAVTAQNAVELQGSCVADYKLLGPVPASIVDSSEVALAADALGGSAFLGAYPGATKIVGVLGPYWEVEYTTCSFFASGGTGTQFAAFFYATNGTLYSNSGVGQAPCP